MEANRLPIPVDSEAKSACRILIVGSLTSLIGLVIFLIRTKISETPVGQWVTSWYDISLVKYYGRGPSAGSYIEEIGNLICVVMVFGGLGVAYIGFEHLRDHGHLNL